MDLHGDVCDTPSIIRPGAHHAPCDPYVIISCGHKKVCQTEVIQDKSNPNFDKICTFKRPKDWVIKIEMRDDDPLFSGGMSIWYLETNQIGKPITLRSNQNKNHEFNALNIVSKWVDDSQCA